MAGQPEDSVNSLLIVTDGDFDEPGLEQRMQAFAADGCARTHTRYRHTGGDAVPGRKDYLDQRQKRTGGVSALNEPLLQSMAKAGGGIYQRADYREQDTSRILDEVKAQALPRGAADDIPGSGMNASTGLPGSALLLLLPLFRRTLPGYRPASEARMTLQSRAADCPVNVHDGCRGVLVQDTGTGGCKEISAG